MKKLNLLYSALVVLSILFSACSDKNTNNETPHQHEEILSITLNQEQMSAAGIKTQKAEKSVQVEVLKCTGIIDVPPQNMASVTAPIGGFVKAINFYVSQEVKKGDVVMELEHTDYIQLQQDFLEMKAKTGFLKQQFDREKELAKEDAVSLKKVQETEADYLSLKAKMAGAKTRLEMLGINTQNLSAENFSSKILIKAPFNGFITEINAQIGTYSGNNTLFKMANNDHYHLELQVFEKDAAKVKKGQKVNFRVYENNLNLEAEVYLVGQQLTDNNKTIGLHAHMEEDYKDLKVGAFAEAEIIIESDSLYSIPFDAVLEDEKGFYFLYKTGDVVKKSHFQKGRSFNNNIEILNPNEKLENTELIISGAKKIAALFDGEVDEVGHSH